MELQKIFLYRITHIDNIPHILRHGITHRNSKNANREYRAIGDTDLISTRDHRHVIIDNGQRFNEGKSIVLGDFIPFYFGIRMPMLYVIQRGGNFVPHAVEPSDIIYIACPLLSVANTQTEYYYSNGHATEALTSFYDKTHLDRLPEIINWEAVKAKYWGGSENLMLKWQKQAEFLAADDIPADCIYGYICHDDKARQRLTSLGIDANNIKVIPTAYY